MMILIIYSKIDLKRNKILKKEDILGSNENRNYKPSPSFKRESSNLHIQEFMMAEMEESDDYESGKILNFIKNYLYFYLIEEQDLSEINLLEFWNTTIDWENKQLLIDPAPFIILPDTAIEKIIFLYSILNVNKIFVVKDGHLLGTITKKELLKEHSERNKINDLTNELIAPGKEYPTAIKKQL